MWSKGNRNWTLIIVAGQTLVIVALTAIIVGSFDVTPADVLRAQQEMKTEIQVQTDVMRSQITANMADIARLRKQMAERTEMLKRANEALLKLDPSYKVEFPVE